MRFSLHAAVALACVCGSAAFAQSVQLQVQIGNNIANITNGNSVQINSPGLGVAQQATLIIRYAGSGQLTLNPPQLAGSGDFTASPISVGNLSLGETAQVQITYKPTTTDGASAILTIPVVETVSTGSSSSSSSTGLITVGFGGVVPNFIFAYAFTSDGNFVPLPQGGQITFPSTPVSSNTTANLTIVNRGTGAGTITAINVTGADFQGRSIPFLPATLAVGQSLTIGIRYAPSQAGSSTGSVQVSTAAGTTTFALQGTAVSPALIYELILGDGTTTSVLPGGSVNVPSTAIGDTGVFSFRIRNNGTSDAIISSLNITGNGYQLANTITLPQTIAASSSLVLPIRFTPTQAGTQRGQLLVNNVSFDLIGVGLGVQLTYAYGSTAPSTTLIPNGTVVFSPAQIGTPAQLRFFVTNNGTAAATVSSIAVSDATSPFHLTDVPALPATLNPGTSISFGMSFTPTTTGITTSSLRIDTQSFVLSGSGQPPPALPAYQIDGPSGTIAPLNQPSVGLHLVQSYPITVTGKLTISTSSTAFAADPAVQFSTGGQTVAFTIPANTTDAVFTNNSNRVQFQTGSVAGQIYVTPSFTVGSGYDITPSSPLQLQVTVQSLAPTLVSASLANITASSMSLVVTGFSTTRSLTSMQLQFTANGANLASAQLTVPLQSASSVWFNSATSQAFGGQFLITVPLGFRSSDSAQTSPANAIQSIAVTVSNAQGSSNSLTVSR